MSELADFISELQPLAPCALFLKPLKGGAVDANAMIDWERFAGQLDAGEIALNTFSPCHGAAAVTGADGGAESAP